MIILVMCRCVVSDLLLWCRLTLERQVKVINENTVMVPQICQWYMKDFEIDYVTGQSTLFHSSLIKISYDSFCDREKYSHRLLGKLDTEAIHRGACLSCHVSSAASISFHVNPYHLCHAGEN